MLLLRSLLSIGLPFPVADTSSDAGGDAALPPRPELSPARCNLILGIIVLSTTLYSTSILIVASVLPQLQGALSATPDEISWAMTFNILATAVATPLTSWLAGRLGRRNLLVVSLIIFTVATYFSGAATSLEMLIFWRIVQGAAGAPLSPMGQTVLLDIFPKHVPADFHDGSDGSMIRRRTQGGNQHGSFAVSNFEIGIR